MLMKAQPEEQTAALTGLVRQMLGHLGEDAQRPGLERTPERVAASLQFLTQGYQLDVDSVINGALFEAEYDEMVIVKDVEVYSLCEHHLLPFYGKCHLAYLPDRKVIGLSKMARIVDVLSRRLQIQERLTTEIASAVKEHLEPKGVGVVIEAYHFCMMMRGVQKQNSQTVTSCMLGRFKTDSKTRSEFLEFLR